MLVYCANIGHMTHAFRCLGGLLGPCALLMLMLIERGF